MFTTFYAGGSKFWLNNKGLVEATLYLGSIIAGIGMGWASVVMGEYVGSCAKPATAAFYYGFAWMWYMGSEIVGNPVAGYVVDKVHGPLFFLIMGASMVIVLLVITTFFFEEPEKSQATENEQSFLETLKDTIILIVDKRMLMYHPLAIYTGISIAIWSGILTPIMVL